jgi:hypothetical protein
MNKILEMKFGAVLYGTETVNSDQDFKAIYIPTAREIVLNTYKKTISTQRPKREGERNTKDDVDIEIFSVDRYLKLLSEGQTVALDILFAPDNMFTYKQWGDHTFSFIKENKDKLLCKDLAAFIGYAKQQAAKYGLKGFRVAALRDTLECLELLSPTTKLSSNMTFIASTLVYKNMFAADADVANELKSEYVSFVTLDDKNGNPIQYLKVCDKFYCMNARVKDIKEQLQKRFDEYGSRALKAEKNEGIDWKALSHAVRVNNQGIELLNTGHITFPRPDRELLLSIKTGQMEYNQVADIIVQGLEDLKTAQATSSLRDKPDQQWIDDFVYDLYKQIVMQDQ